MEGPTEPRGIYTGLSACFFGLAIGFLATALGMHLPLFISDGVSLPLVLLNPLIFGATGVLIAVLTSHKPFGAGIFAGTMFAFVAMLSFWGYYFTNSAR